MSKLASETSIKFPPAGRGSLIFAVCFSEKITSAKLFSSDLLIGVLDAEEIYKDFPAEIPARVPLNFFGEEVPLHVGLLTPGTVKVELTWMLDSHKPIYPSLAECCVDDVKNEFFLEQQVVVAGRKRTLVYSAGRCAFKN